MTVSTSYPDIPEERAIEALRRKLETISLDLRNTRSTLSKTKLELQNTQDALANSERARQAANLDRIVKRLPRDQEVFVVLKLQSPQPLPTGGYRLYTLQRKTVDPILNKFIADKPKLDAVVMNELRFDRSPRGHNVFERIKDDKNALIESSRRRFVVKSWPHGGRDDQWAFLHKDWPVVKRTKFHRTEIKEVRDMCKVKDFVNQRLGTIPVFFFLAGVFGKRTYPGPYHNVEKGLLVLYMLLKGLVISDMGEFMSKSSFHDVFKDFFARDDQHRQHALDAQLTAYLDGMCSSIRLRLLTARSVNPVSFKHITLHLDGHDS
ncbi:hypothetical protein BGZ99_000555 [Dissophora globulifera]|uniref:Uncharacterized protein n=1 Tax=Dissophora globulifera TaxID=979702 RepID=A0A9P6UKA1_9FUNG|nr:hypothetical protein BGZ99_000555 [Dissophora globulifera]